MDGAVFRTAPSDGFTSFFLAQAMASDAQKAWRIPAMKVASEGFGKGIPEPKNLISSGDRKGFGITSFLCSCCWMPVPVAISEPLLESNRIKAVLQKCPKPSIQMESEKIILQHDQSFSTFGHLLEFFQKKDVSPQ